MSPLTQQKTANTKSTTMQTHTFEQSMHAHARMRHAVSFCCTGRASAHILTTKEASEETYRVEVLYTPHISLVP